MKEKETFTGNKMRVIFNDEEKIIEISDELYSRQRIVNELAGMSMEENKLLNLDKRFCNVPLIYLPNIIPDIFEDTELDKVAQKKSNDFDEEIRLIIKDNFKVNNPDHIFIEEYVTSKEDKQNKIVFEIRSDDESPTI